MSARALVAFAFAVAAAPLLASATATAADSVDEPAGYRMADYDAPVPAGLVGAETVAAADVLRLVAERDAVVVDVVPEQRRPAALPPGQKWFPVEHAGLPGALWLPDTGYGALDPLTERYLFEHLERATAGDLGRALVFYCRMDCWMSWNAAKRALAAGYRAVYWYRDGIDDWRFEDHPTEILTPAPGVRHRAIDDD